MLVRGAPDILVKLAKCCTPVPGDDIVGFVTRGSGVSVHRYDCVNVKALSAEHDRMVEVTWAPTSCSVFLVQIQVEALDRSGLLSDVTRVLSEHHVNILSATVQTTSRPLGAQPLRVRDGRHRAPRSGAERRAPHRRRLRRVPRHLVLIRQARPAAQARPAVSSDPRSGLRGIFPRAGGRAPRPMHARRAAARVGEAAADRASSVPRPAVRRRRPAQQVDEGALGPATANPAMCCSPGDPTADRAPAPAGCQRRSRRPVRSAARAVGGERHPRRGSKRRSSRRTRRRACPHERGE